MTQPNRRRLRRRIRSFRDPDGMLFARRPHPARVKPAARQALQRFLKTRTAREAMEHGKLVRSTRVDPGEFPEIEAVSAGEHERIPFPSFPYEWPAEMLHAAGALTLDLADSALEEGFGLKDATPYNVLFRGAAAGVRGRAVV